MLVNHWKRFCIYISPFGPVFEIPWVKMSCQPRGVDVIENSSSQVRHIFTQNLICMNVCFVVGNDVMLAFLLICISLKLVELKDRWLEENKLVQEEFPWLNIRAGYRSKFFDTDTLSSIPVPEQYFFRYQFYEISFNKIYIISKNFGFIFFSLLIFIQTQRLISWATAQRNKIYPTQ